MAFRTFAQFAAPIALLAAAAAHAEPISGDIVDEILQTMPPAPGQAQPAPPAVTPPAVTPAPVPPVQHPAPAPIAQAPLLPPGQTPAPAAASPTPIAQAQATPPAGQTPPPAPGTPAPIAQVPLPPPAPHNPPAIAQAPMPSPTQTPAQSSAPKPAVPPPGGAQPAPAFDGHSNGDIIDQAMQSLPAQPESALPWRGYYFGVNVGYGTTHGGNGVSCVNTVSNDTSGCPVIADSGFSASGPLGGGQIGYLLPVSLGGTSLIVGAETDLQGSGVSASRNNPGPFAFSGFPQVCSPCSYSASEKLDWFGTFRLRIGVPIDNFLIYATGGAIYGGASVTQNVSFNGSSGYLANTSKRVAGPTVGGGIEWMLPDSPWSARLEALYYDLGKVSSVTTPQSGFAGNFFETKTFALKGAIIRLGINLRLGDLGTF